MSDYRRYVVPGGTFFFTAVTERRARLFAVDSARRLLGSVMRRCFLRYPVEVVAIVLLPDHLHALWTLPTGDDAYSLRWPWIKREFTRAWLAVGELPPLGSGRALRHRLGGRRQRARLAGRRGRVNTRSCAPRNRQARGA